MPNQKKDTPMQITVRLYRQHDMDLVGLYRTKDFKFQRHMKNALKAYAEGKDYRINHPGDEDIRKGYVPKIVQMHIYLTVEQDADAISALKTIREGYRGAFLKALFRKYLNNEPLEAYKDRKDLIFNAEEDYLEAPEEAAGNKKEYDKSRKDFGKSGCDNSAGVSAKKDNWKEKSIPPSGKPAQNQHDSRNGQSGAPEIQQDHHAVQQHQKEIEYRKQKENQKKMQDHQNSDRNRALASDTKREEQWQQNRTQETKNGNQNTPNPAKNRHQMNGLENGGKNFSSHEKNVGTNTQKEDIMDEKGRKADSGHTSGTPKKREAYHPEEKTEDKQKFSFFDDGIDETSKNDAPAEIPFRKERPSEADTDIPFSFFDDPDGDASELLAQMNNLAH